MIVTEFTIARFVADCKANGLSNVWAALPASHALVKTCQVGQIRKVKSFYASALDELGNQTILTRDGYVKQLVTAAEIKKAAK